MVIMETLITVAVVTALAQSFIVDEEDGVFITSLDVFFATKSSTIL